MMFHWQNAKRAHLNYQDSVQQAKIEYLTPDLRSRALEEWKGAGPVRPCRLLWLTLSPLSASDDAMIFQSHRFADFKQQQTIPNNNTMGL